MSVNKVILVGRLGQDPEVKTLNSGDSVANFSLATSKKWKSKEGEQKEKTEWHRIVAFKKLAELAGKYLTKGRQVYVEGELQTRSWEQDGVKRYSTEIVANSVQFLGDAKQASTGQADSGGTGGDAPSFDNNEENPF